MSKKQRKYIFVVGGVLSGVGKGITSASLALILKSTGLKVTVLKIDPYINVDAGTMNPIEHGEVFVTDDGDETDQDIGNYERFLNTDLGAINYMTTGRVYSSVINNERSMKYGGKCVEVVPHIPEEVIKRVRFAADHYDADVTIIEVGGTVGEYQNILFLEAVRIMKFSNPSSVATVLVSYLPVPEHLGEMKTKPTQQAARLLYSAGISMDMIIARGHAHLDQPRCNKLAIATGVHPNYIFSAPDVKSIYELPLVLDEQGVVPKLLKLLKLRLYPSKLDAWKSFVKRIKNSKKTARIAVIGKYFSTGNYTLSDSYISVIEAVRHAAWYYNAQTVLTWLDSEVYEKNPNALQDLKNYDGIIVPGGFGTRGIEGIIQAISFARKNKIPYLGLCYGMQLAVVEFCRNELGLEGAHTKEINKKTKHPVIDINPYQSKNVNAGRYGGTMRLGAYQCELKKGSLTAKAYGALQISERHRHRYEFNNKYREQIETCGMSIVGVNTESNLVEIIEISDHPFFVGTQFHPEFKSRPLNPHPLFREFIKKALVLR